MAQYQLVHFNLNGKDVERMVDVRASLTDMLRNDYHMTSVKKGCEVGECGACNVIIDGECFNSCIYLAVWAEGKRIRTLESLMGPNGELSDIQQAFIEETAVQCGFCTPGFIMTAVEILESGKLYMTVDQNPEDQARAAVAATGSATVAGSLAMDVSPAAFLASATASATFSAAAVAAFCAASTTAGAASRAAATIRSLMPSASLLIVSPLSCWTRRLRRCRPRPRAASSIASCRIPAR